MSTADIEALDIEEYLFYLEKLDAIRERDEEAIRKANKPKR